MAFQSGKKGFLLIYICCPPRRDAASEVKKPFRFKLDFTPDRCHRLRCRQRRQRRQRCQRRRRCHSHRQRRCRSTRVTLCRRQNRLPQSEGGEKFPPLGIYFISKKIIFLFASILRMIEAFKLGSTWTPSIRGHSSEAG